MSAPSEGLSATKPVSAWNQPLDVQFKDLFKALGKAAVHGAVGKWDSGARDLVDAASAVGLKEQPEQLAWLLIFRSLAHAVDELGEERRDLLRRENRDLESLADEIDLSLEDAEVTVDRRFFEHPRSLSLLDDFQQPLTEWLIGAGFAKAEAEDVAQRFPTYFVFALHQEWRTSRDLYLPIQQALDTPFTRAAERETRWREYSAWLRKQVDEPLFGKEAFSLRQIYIPLRGYFERPDVKPDPRRRGRSEEIPFEIDTVQRIVVDLNQELEDWLDAEGKSDAIRVLSGGPGSGKSSLARMFAAKQAEREDLRVLFVPLHLLDVEGKLENAIADFAQRDLYLPEKPMDPKAPASAFSSFSTASTSWRCRASWPGMQRLISYRRSKMSCWAGTSKSSASRSFSPAGFWWFKR